MKIEITLATAADAEGLVAIQQQAFKRLYEIYRDEGNPYLRGTDEIISWLERPNWRVYKIIADGVLCGGVSFCERNGMPGVYYLARIYILPELQRKGIASAAILLCEDTVANANLWTLDFPVKEIMNRKCYEKAGYTDSGKRREQSGGAISLAYMEKYIPQFRDVKKHIYNPMILKIMAASFFDPTPEKMAAKAEDFRQNESWRLFAWVANGEILGVCGIELYSDYIEILNIAVAEHSRHSGVGRAMIETLKAKYDMAIKAETDDDAIGFYKKCGFETTEIYKQCGDNPFRRWNCILPAQIETDEKRRAE